MLDEHAKDKPEITFLNVDVEGFEKQVFSGIDFKRYHPRVIMAESTTPLTEVATHQLWESILIDNGYIFAMDDGLNRYYVHSSHASRSRQCSTSWRRVSALTRFQPVLILFDYGTPKGLIRARPGHTVHTAQAKGWDALSNGALLKAAEEAGVDVLLTTDRRIARVHTRRP